MVGGIGVSVGGIGVSVGGIGVSVGGIGVLVGGIGVSVGGIGVLVGGIGVSVGGTGVLVGGIGVLVGVGIDVIERGVRVKVGVGDRIDVGILADEVDVGLAAIGDASIVGANESVGVTIVAVGVLVSRGTDVMTRGVGVKVGKRVLVTIGVSVANKLVTDETSLAELAIKKLDDIDTSPQMTIITIAIVTFINLLRISAVHPS